MKHLLLLLLSPLFVYSQFCPSLGPDQILPCGVGTTTLTANLSQCGVGGPTPNQTTNYSVSPIPYVNQTNTGNQLFMTDDSQQGPFNIGFTFCFFGQTYTQFWVGSNGWISFSPGQPTTFTTQTIPTANFLVPKNCIMGPWQDWHPGLGGQIRYQTVGVAPCRKLIVSWVNIPMYICTANQGTFHIVIHESTNYIDSYIQSKPACLQWQGGTATQGVHNIAGTIGITSPGRNSSVWTATNDAYRWTPTGPVVLPTLTWYQVGNPIPIGTGPTINVTPPAAGASYTCHFVYPTCNAGWNTCNVGQGGNLGPDTVFVLPGPPNLPQPTINAVNPTCYQSCDGVIVVTPVGGNGVQTISWNGSLPNSFTNIGVCQGNYSFTITDSQGCTVSSNVTLVDPPQVTITPITGLDTICYNSTTNTFNVSSVFPNLTYNWSTTIGSITSGQGTTQINLDVTGVNSGLYSNALNVYAVDQIGCISDNGVFDVFIFNLQPLVTQIGPFCEYDGCISLTATPPNGTFSGNNVWLNDYCPDNGFIGTDNVNYQVTQSGCWFDTTINVDVFPRPTIIPVIDGRVGVNYEYHELCDGDSIQDIYEAQSPFVGYNEWYVFGDTIQDETVDLTWNQEGIFTFDVVRWSNGCVSFPETITVALSLCPQEIIYIPNTFTPDGNEHNQYFLPIITSGVDLYSYHMTIYNRWGEVIWETFDSKVGWDGTYNNILCPDGSYTWVLEFKVIDTDEKKEYHGNLTIIR
jgi:gliding motility-associated-like protein